MKGYIAAIFIPALPDFNDAGKYNAADIGWILVATALVFLMTPGLAPDLSPPKLVRFISVEYQRFSALFL